MKDVKNQKFGRLIAENYIGNYKWKCLCDCGNSKNILVYHLLSGAIRSCGCLNTESRIKNNKNRAKYENKIDLLKYSIYKTSYFKTINDTISFKYFYKLSQQNCYYCNSKPSNTCKSENIKFIYNGLDRINSNFGHTQENCVSCCFKCNSMKQRLSQKDFFNWINSIKFSYDFKINIPNIDFEKNLKKLRSISNAKKPYCFYNDGDLSFNQFIFLCKQNCFYCGAEPKNIAKRKGVNPNKAFIYNGLDRIDSSKKHDIYNVVPCCKTCNFAKNNMNINEFYAHVKKIKKFFTKERIIKNSSNNEVYE